MYARVAWSLTVLSGCFAVVDTVLTAAYHPLLSEQTVAVHGWPLTTTAALGSAVMGALIVSRYARHPIGWLLVLLGTTTSISMAAEAYSLWVVKGNGAGPLGAGELAGWISAFFGGAMAVSTLTLMFLLVPDGHLLSRRWRWVAVAAATGLTSWLTGLILTPPSKVVIGDNSPSLDWFILLLLNVGFILIGLALIASAVSLVIRLRRAQGELRQQLRWIASAAAVLPVGLIVLVVVQATNGGRPTWLASLPLFSAFLALPICIAIAVLRYRLYDIDLIINRAVILAAGTAFAAAGYIALVAGIAAVVGANTTGFWPSLVALVIVALAFQPLRRRVVRVADRLAYGSRATPYEELADFSRRLGDSLDPELLLPAVAQAAGQVVGAETAVARLHVMLGAERTAGWPAKLQTTTSPPDAEIPVLDHGEELGGIDVVMPAGRALRAADRAMLVDIAAQTGLAFRNAQLAAELASRVELLDRRTADLAESRTRIIEARDAERVRLERAIQRDVISHLKHIPSDLSSVAHGDGEPSPVLQRLIDDVTSALEALRELTRGIYSTQLARFGLGPAMTGHLRAQRGEVVVNVDDSAAGKRLDARIESAAYFCYLTAVRELLPPVTVTLSLDGVGLCLVVAAGDDSAPDLRHLQDRIEPLDGSVSWVQEADRGTLTVTIPVSVAVDQPVAVDRPVADDQTPANRSAPNVDLLMYPAAPQSR